MTLIIWTDELIVNVLEIDEQHRRLVAMLNELHDSMMQGKGKEVMGKTLGSLVSYTKYHFSTEERLMLSHSYPGYQRHKAAHATLTKQATELHMRVQQGSSVITQEVMNFLKDWLNSHIRIEDKKYAPFLKNKGVA